ncbi:hypothetical protein ACFY2J_16500 [Streptomyces collinus]|uniref:hypothetical protein n=1 Tax=Streptomyces collinus TaxID=42684 RepID=UPI0036C67A18
MTETCVREMHARAADSKAGLVDALRRRGMTLADARQLADRLSNDPTSHRDARNRIALELRPA